MKTRLTALPIIAIALIACCVVAAQPTTARVAPVAPAFLIGTLIVDSVSPAPHINNADCNAPIEITFDRSILPASVTPQSFWAFGKWSGAADGAFSFSNDDQTVTLTPERPFSAGEQVMVILSNELQAADGSPLRTQGFSFQFFVRAQPAADLHLIEIDEMTTRSMPQVSTRSYGGIATDLNEDGWMDITVVNENTADLRTFLNLADSTGLYGDFLVPPAEVNDRASPSEPTDFNRDGHADICVVNIDTDSVSILLGNGDGTFAPQQEITVGDAPRGIAVLDVDGDGDADIVNTNSGGSGNLSLLLNNGNGVFGSPTFFDGGGTDEWSLAAADMDNDNVLDLVVGAQSSQQILINRCNGDGTFSNISSQSSGGRTWMLVCGDLDNDGDQDVTSANSSNNNGSVLLGNGDGTLAAPTTYSTDSFPLATDVADLDGDGDLDWVTASFSGDWFLFTNDGDGTFTFNQEIDAPIAASCSLAVDIDNDRDLDLVLIDELADVVILMRNGGYTAVADSFTAFRGFYNSGTLNDTFTSNDSYLKFKPGITLNSGDSPVWLIFDGTLATDNPKSLEFALESSANTVGLSQTIEMFDFNANQFVEIETLDSTFNKDSVQTVDLSAGIGSYVQAKTGAIRARFGYRQTGFIILYPWTVRIDRVSWTQQ